MFDLNLRRPSQPLLRTPSVWSDSLDLRTLTGICLVTGFWAAVSMAAIFEGGLASPMTFFLVMVPILAAPLTGAKGSVAGALASLATLALMVGMHPTVHPQAALHALALAIAIGFTAAVAVFFSTSASMLRDAARAANDRTHALLACSADTVLVVKQGELSTLAQGPLEIEPLRGAIRSAVELGERLGDLVSVSHHWDAHMVEIRATPTPAGTVVVIRDRTGSMPERQTSPSWASMRTVTPMPRHRGV
jgi:hypothetical protein